MVLFISVDAVRPPSVQDREALSNHTVTGNFSQELVSVIMTGCVKVLDLRDVVFK